MTETSDNASMIARKALRALRFRVFASRWALLLGIVRSLFLACFGGNSVWLGYLAVGFTCFYSH